MTSMSRIVLISVITAIVATISAGARAEPNRVTFPKNLDQYVFYGDYRRGSGGEMAYALPETLAVAKSGQSMPNGTRLVLAILRNNAVSSYFVMEKGEGFGLDYDPERRTADWQFQQFDLGGEVMASTNTAQCQSCHAGSKTDFRFTIDRMVDYMP